MTPLDFIASLEHGEAKAAALTIYNLMTPKWIEITDDPATLPEKYKTVIIRNSDDYESFGSYRSCVYTGEAGEFCWYESHIAEWSQTKQCINPKITGYVDSITHWRPIG